MAAWKHRKKIYLVCELTEKKIILRFFFLRWLHFSRKRVRLIVIVLRIIPFVMSQGVVSRFWLRPLETVSNLLLRLHIKAKIVKTEPLNISSCFRSSFLSSFLFFPGFVTALCRHLESSAGILTHVNLLRWTRQLEVEFEADSRPPEQRLFIWDLGGGA